MSSETIIKGAMSIAKDAAEGRVNDANLDAELAQELQCLFGAVSGPGDPLFEMQTSVARAVLAAGGLTADEIAEWLAVARSREAAHSPSPASEPANPHPPTPKPSETGSGELSGETVAPGGDTEPTSAPGRCTCGESEPGTVARGAFHREPPAPCHVSE